MKNRYRIDFSRYPETDFRMVEGDDLHLIGPDDGRTTLRVSRLVVDEAPHSFGTNADVGQVAETADGRWVLCVSVDEPPYAPAVDVFDSREGVTRWLWDTPDPYAAADCLVLLWCLNGIRLNPASWGPELPKSVKWKRQREPAANPPHGHGRTGKEAQ